MALIQDLVEKITDEDLKKRIKKEIDNLTNQKKYGLVFEQHLPECTPLYNVPIKIGALVSLNNKNIQKVMYVRQINGDIALCESRETGEYSQVSVSELICVSQFGDPIYPSLQFIDSVNSASNSELWHSLIEADNYHALQLLQYIYPGKFDCIYIDPPYNTGARDWKYNNDYVDSNDQYRHSKWLSFMERRLKLAKKLLNPKDSVLIVTIDEKEYLHLGCLLEELFPYAKIQMVSSVINPAGAGKDKTFSRTDEYIFFVQIGNVSIVPESRELNNIPITWDTLRRSSLANARGKHGKGACGPNQFYPIYVDNKSGRIKEIGEPISENIDRRTVIQKDGCTAVFPVRPNGTEMNWGITAEKAREIWNKGYLRAGKYSPNAPQQYVISYVTGGIIQDIESGIAIKEGYNQDGSVIAYYPTGKDKMPTTNWNRSSHDAQRYGTNLLTKFIGNRFNYPKSLYAVHDAIRFFVSNKTNALILDFFAGSGTTLHAVNLLNAEDNGQRRCIMVTNNEVSAEEAKKFIKKGLHPGDEEWEAHGIARYVTWPRTVCSIEGHDINNKPLEGNYLGSEIPMSKGFKSNVVYYKLGFLDKTAVELGLQFKEILPILWLKAGARGKPLMIKDNEGIPEYMILPQNHMAILADEFAFHKFNTELKKNKNIDVLYIVTNSETNFKEMAALTGVKECYQLYKDYLDNFRLNCER